MSVEPDIKNLDDLLRSSICSDADIVDTRITRLTGPGENYGSIMQRVDIDLKSREDGRKKTVHAVAKLVPPDPKIQKIFNTQVTFKNEIAFYSIIVPTLVEFQKEEGMEGMKSFADFLGGRINLNGSDVVDEDAVLMLDNLKMSGYRSVERGKGFDLEIAKLILKDLAEFHAVAISLKLKKPGVFDRKIRPHLHSFDGSNDESIAFSEIVKAILSENEECIPLIPKIRSWGERNSFRKIREPFATINHQDLWVNNMMQIFEEGKPLSNKFVDFQIIDYISNAADVFFFIFTNLQLSVLKEHLDHLLLYYHQSFVKVLKYFHCDIEPFSYDNFLEELRIEAEYELPHALMFATFVFMNIVQESPPDEENNGFDKEKFLPLVDKEIRERLQYIVLECDRRGWVY